MKINSLQVGDSDLHGRRFNGHDLSQYLTNAGLNSSHLVMKKLSSDSNTHLLFSQFTQDYNELMATINNRYDAQSVFNQGSYELLFNQLFLDADIVHYHLIHNNFFNITHLPILTRLKPTIWTLHDPWAITGHCIHSFDCQNWQNGCGNCPDLQSDFPIKRDTTALNWKFKEISYKNSDFDVIVASKWMFDKVSLSPLFKNKKIHLIPFGLNLEVFKPQNKKTLRENFGIPYENFVICFRSISWGLKGFKYTEELLKLLKNVKNITIISFNELALLKEFESYFQIIELGTVYDEEKLAQMYAVSDIFISTSLAESFGLSALESIACGTPVLAFDNTAITEVIEAPFAGIVVPETNIYAMKDKLMELKADPDKLTQLSLNARILAEKKYNKTDYIKKIIHVYKEVIDRRHFDSRSNFIISQQRQLLAKRQEISDHTNQMMDQNQSMIDLGILNSRVYRTLIKLKQKKSVRILYFKVARPAYRTMKKVRDYVKK